ncbi:hypothetical protein LLT5_10655 [Lactococcus cremoris subsp. cremoris TIFN5]|nr:hypothetical protein LLT5_10655 [Lactococcus cremoris subsp. cremoris TIFN5]
MGFVVIKITNNDLLFFIKTKKEKQHEKLTLENTA